MKTRLIRDGRLRERFKYFEAASRSHRYAFQVEIGYCRLAEPFHSCQGHRFVSQAMYQKDQLAHPSLF